MQGDSYDTIPWVEHFVTTGGIIISEEYNSPGQAPPFPIPGMQMSLIRRPLPPQR